MEFKHVSVLLDECIDALNIKDNGIYVDCTLGGAGHTKEILKKLRGGKLIGIDQDTDALKNAKEILKDYDNVTLVHSNFENIKNIIRTRLIEPFQRWYQRRATILELENLSNHMLADIGITRGEILHAVDGNIYRRGGTDERLIRGY